jgi:hypothetical protein
MRLTSVILLLLVALNGCVAPNSSNQRAPANHATVRAPHEPAIGPNAAY